MNFDNIVAPLTAPSWVIARLSVVDIWKAEIRVITDAGKWVDSVFERCLTAASTTTMSNWTFTYECMERIKGMALRGDSQEQIDEWVAHLPDELLMTLERERLALGLGIYKAGWPGGPGAIFPKTE